MLKRLQNKQKWPAERISHWVIVAEVALTAVVFALFYLVGFEMPYYENPDFNAPLLTDMLIVFMELMLAATILTCLVAVARKLRKKSRASLVNGINTSKILIGVVMLVAVLLALTFILGSGEEMLINGKIFDNVLLLKLTDMFVHSSIVLLALTTIAAFWGTLRHLKLNNSNN